MDRPAAPADHDELLAQLGWMRTLARRLARDSDVADDVLQRACLLALQRPAEVASGGAGLRAWLSVVLRRLAGHRRREDARRASREQAAASREALPATIDVAARREILRKLVEALTTLEEPGFSTLVRRYYDGLSTLQIAAQDGVSPEVVRQRLQRARARLRERLETLLDPRWLPALALLSPPPASAAPPTLSQLVMRGLIMAETTARPFAWKAAAAAAFVALGAGSWYVLGARDDESPRAPAAALPPVAELSRAAPALPALPSVPARPAKPQSASVALAEQPAPPPAPAPAAPSEGAAWTSLWSLADATVQGTLELDQMLDTAQTLLELTRARLAAEGATTLDDPTVPFVILDTEGVGRATLALASSPSDEEQPWKSYAFEVDLDTQDGRYTGLTQGKPDRTDLRISFYVDSEGRPSACNTTVQNFPAGTAELFAHMLGRGPLPHGGALSAKGDTVDWRPLNVEAITADPKTGAPLDDIAFFHTFGEPVPREGSIADPRAASIAQGLSALRPRSR